MKERQSKYMALLVRTNERSHASHKGTSQQHHIQLQFDVKYNRCQTGKVSANLEKCPIMS